MPSLSGQPFCLKFHKMTKNNQLLHFKLYSLGGNSCYLQSLEKFLFCNSSKFDGAMISHCSLQIRWQ